MQLIDGLVRELDMEAARPLPPGILVRPMRELSNTARRAVAGSVVAVLAVAVLVALAAVKIDGGSSAPASLRVSGPAAPMSPQATTSVTPSYLPDGAWIASTQRISGPPITLPPDPTPSAVLAYVNQQDTDTIGLSGPINANNVTKRALAAQADQDHTSGGAAVHGATTITVTFVPTGYPAPHPRQASALFNIRGLTIAGNQAQLTYPANGGSGTYLVAWTDADGYHSVESERIDTTDGLSGVPANTLLQIAVSLYPT